MKFIKIILSMLVGLLVCPETYCDGAVQIQTYDVNLMAELPVIYQAALRNRCNEVDFYILLAIRKAENGRPGREFGILAPKAQALIEKHPERSLDIQAGWAAATIVKNRMRWNRAGQPGNFITFLADRYCPKETDFEGNKNWKRNVQWFYNRLRNI